MGVSLGVDFLALVSEWEKVHSSGVISEGPYVEELEAEISKWSGLQAIVVNSAGSGLYLMALQLDKHSRVAVANNTFYATGAMFKAAGHDLVLVDCNREDFSMSFEHLKTLNPRPDVVVLTHVGGHLALDYHDIALWCEQYGIVFYEDAAHALGVKDDGLIAGKLSNAAVFSLYPTKSLPAGEGGILLTGNTFLAEKWKRQRSYGKSLHDGVMKYGAVSYAESDFIGFNFRMDEWTGVVALLQWQRRQEIQESRERQAETLRGIFGPSMLDNGTATNHYKFPITAKTAKQFGVKRFAGKIYAATDQLQVALGLDPVYLPNSKWVAENHVCLPLHEGIYDNLSPMQVLKYLRMED